MRRNYHVKTILVLGLLLGMIPALSAQESDPGLLITFPPGMNTSELTINYEIAGRFGGFISSLVGTSNTQEYKIPTINSGKRADRLKAFIYIPNYGMQLINISSLVGHATHELIDLKPLLSLPLTGKISMPEGKTTDGFQMRITYLAEWGYRFFGFMDGMCPEILISSNITADGTFTALIPDILRDPALTTFKEKGSMQLTMVDSKTGNMPYELKFADGQPAELKIMDRYPSFLALHAEPALSRAPRTK